MSAYAKLQCRKRANTGRKSPEDVARSVDPNPFVTFAPFCSNPLLSFCRSDHDLGFKPRLHRGSGPLAFLLFRCLPLQCQLRQDLPWEQSRIRCFSEPTFWKCIHVFLLVYRLFVGVRAGWGISRGTSRPSEGRNQSLRSMCLFVARCFLRCTPILDPIPDLQFDASCRVLEELR